MLALFGIRFRSLFFEERRQYSEVKVIAWNLLLQLCFSEMLLGCIRNEISWWLTTNCMISGAININFHSCWSKKAIFLSKAFRKLKRSLDYHLPNLLLIALTIMQLFILAMLIKYIRLTRLVRFISYNDGHNILTIYRVSVKLSFAASKARLRVASRVAKQFK